MYKQILKSLKFFCPMQNKGCTELVTVESIFDHAKVCKHTVTECSTCKHQVKTEDMQSHNCVEYLLQQNNLLKSQNQEYLNQNNALKEEIKNLKENNNK